MALVWTLLSGQREDISRAALKGHNTETSATYQDWRKNDVEARQVWREQNFANGLLGLTLDDRFDEYWAITHGQVPHQ